MMKDNLCKSNFSVLPLFQTKIITILLIHFLTLSIYSQASEDDHVSDEIFVQFNMDIKYSHRGVIEFDTVVETLFSSNPILDIRPVFPEISPDNRLTGMNRTYRIKVAEPLQITETLKSLNKSPEVVYAELVPIRKMYGISNDPLWNSQYHLSLLELDSARDIHGGDSTIVIAIIDGGVNYMHEDLHSDIWVNSSEDVDGDGFLSPADNDSIDADNNGFLDDVIGWDFVHLPGQGFVGEDDSLADNEPIDFGGHGTHCAGDAAAVTNNNTGIASVGGDCSIMCIRAGMTASNGFGYIYYSVEGIYYAANNGAKVISMSYGGPGFSQTEQLAIDFAYNQGVVCIAAAGNDNNNTLQYPANYNHVIAVAATDQQDHKASFSNFGAWIDVSAPGVDILSTTVGGSYGNMGGTSMSTPIVAGLAGLTYAMFPQYSADSVINRIVNNCDNIDSLNPSYSGQLGAGRINAFKTLDKVIRILSYEIKDSLQGNNNGRLDYGETIDLIITLINTYQNVSGLSIKASSQQPLITVLDSIAILGNLSLGGTINNTSSPLSASIGNDSTISMVPILFTITADGNYQYQKVLEFPIGQREILVVNDDETSGPANINYYTQALDSIQKNYDIWDVQQQGAPGLNESLYPVIIWYTGEAEQNVLTTGEQQFLENYLDNGGRLFLTGQNIGYDLVEQQNGITFYENYLHANYVLNNSNDYSLDGLPNDPIGSGETFIILGSGGANNQSSPDVIQAISPAQPAILYDINNQADQAALHFSGNYKLVYFAFGWEGINDNGPAKRKNVMSRVINWLSGISTGLEPSKSEITQKISLYPNYPNPFNPETTIPFALRKSETVSIRIYNSLGQIVKIFPEQKFDAGLHKLRWDGKNQNDKVCASGIYYYQVKIGDQQLIK
ncbi:MAG: S8 family serine peptidase, partial [Calditrichia bacterium]|nr:S8 family serine peptidase [Calditrichia bacterium]